MGFQKHGGETNRPIDLVIYPAPIVLPKINAEQQDVQIKSCAAGRAHLLALSEDGNVYALGNNSYGQCGRPIITNEQYIGSEQVHIIGKVGVKQEKIVNIHCGQDHSLFLTETGKLFSCGWSADGQTGLGHYASVSEPSQVCGDISLERIVKVAGFVDCVLALNGLFYLTEFLNRLLSIVLNTFI